jgi:prefoldin alpha subunit
MNFFFNNILRTNAKVSFFQVIDIGTGYYVEKDIAASKEYFNKKVKYVTEQMEKVQVFNLTKNKKFYPVNKSVPLNNITLQKQQFDIM